MNKMQSKELAERDGLIPVQGDELTAQTAPELPKPDSPAKIIRSQKYHIPAVKQGMWIFVAWIILGCVAFAALAAWLISMPQVGQEIQQNLNLLDGSRLVGYSIGDETLR